MVFQGQGFGAGTMGSKRAKPSRRKASSVKRRGAKGGRWGRLLKVSVGVAAVLACAFLVYSLWSGKAARPPGHPPKGEPSEPPTGQMRLTLFFSDSQAEFLLGEERVVPQSATPLALARAVMEELARGPRTPLHHTLPKGTRVLKVDLGGDGLCTVDFSGELQRGHPGGSSAELMTVYSIVESLAANVPGVKAVQILIEGKKADTLAGHISIGGPISSEPGYVKKW